MSERIKSKYYFIPLEFLESKLPHNNFSIVHINIASLSKHIDELRCLINLNHPLDVIGITETRLYDENPTETFKSMNMSLGIPN